MSYEYLANATMDWSMSDFVLDQNCVLFLDFYHAKASIYRPNFYAVASMSSVLSVFTILLNASVLITVLKTPRLATATNTYICSLAISDLCTGLFTESAFSFLLLSLVRDRFNCVVLMVSTAVAFICFLLTLFSLALITLERFLAMFHPFYYWSTFNSKKVAVKLVLLALMVSIAVGVGSIFSRNFIAFEIAFPTVCSLVIPWCLYVNWRALKMVIKINQDEATRKAVLNNEQQPTDDIHAKRGSTSGLTISAMATAENRKAARLTLILVFFMLLCYGPELLVKVYSFAFDGKTDIVKVIRAWTQLFVMFNSFLNPLLYCWQLKGFRTEIFKVVFCQKKVATNDSSINLPSNRSNSIVADHSCSKIL